MVEFLERKDSKFVLGKSTTQSSISKSSTQSSGLRTTPSPTKKTSRMFSGSSAHNTFGTKSSMSSMSFQRTQSAMVRPMTGTQHSKRPISAGAVASRRPVTAVDFGETTGVSLSVRSRAGTIESHEEDPEENWFVDHHEASVCLVVGSDESDDDEGDESGRTKTSEDTLRDMVKTANEYFAKSAGDGGNWWE